MSSRDPFYHERLILVDAHGFTTTCRLQEEVKEMGRRPMMAPITIYHWKRVTGGPHGGWKLQATFQWVPLGS
jgi:hypothetical protein